MPIIIASRAAHFLPLITKIHTVKRELMIRILITEKTFPFTKKTGKKAIESWILAETLAGISYNLVRISSELWKA
jgi:hypothetical protein